MNFYPSCLPFPHLVRQEQPLEATQHATDLSRVLDILNETEAILTASDFEPTPLGPNVLFLSTDTSSSSSSSSSDEPIVSRLPSSLKRGFVNTDEDDYHHSSSMMFQQVFQEEEPGFSGSDGYAAVLLASSPEPKKRRLDFSPSLVSGMGMSGANLNNFHHHQEEEEEEDSRGHFRQYQADQWNDRFQELLDFKEATGHCLVPHDYPTNQKLAQWVKRQRYQYKLKQAGRHSTLTDVRQMELESFGFVWDSHQAAWDEKYETLKAFRMMYGHCNVPSHYSEDKALAVWIKCQRRQMKLLLKGQKTSLNECRISRLNGLAFEWNPRNL